MVVMGSSPYEETRYWWSGWDTDSPSSTRHSPKMSPKNPKDLQVELLSLCYVSLFFVGHFQQLRPRGCTVTKSSQWSKDMEMQLVSIERLCEYERPQPTETPLPGTLSTHVTGLELRNVIVRCGNVLEKRVDWEVFESQSNFINDRKMTWLMCVSLSSVFVYTPEN